MTRSGGILGRAGVQVAVVGLGLGGSALYRARTSDSHRPTPAASAFAPSFPDALLWWHLARSEADLGMADDARATSPPPCRSTPT